MTRESATQTFACGRRIRVLADEYGDHGCGCPECQQAQDEADERRLSKVACDLEAKLSDYFASVECDADGGILDVHMRGCMSLANHPNPEDTMAEQLGTELVHAGCQLFTDRAEFMRAVNAAAKERWGA